MCSSVVFVVKKFIRIGGCEFHSVKNRKDKTWYRRFPILWTEKRYYNFGHLEQV